MRTLLAFTLGLTLAAIIRATWTHLLGWTLSRGD